MEAHGSPLVEASHKAVAMLPDVLAKPLMTNVGVDRLAALYSAVEAVRRAGRSRRAASTAAWPTRCR